MLDVQTVDRVEFKRHQQHDWTEAAMADETDDPAAAADRLEAALERIAHLAAHVPPAPPVSGVTENEANLPAVELVARLDRLIDRLRTALGGKPG
ncbi:MAG TPA: hypothetical protein VIG49_05240 [Acetobacteraceae bacterium]|jgi:hypothetical protein